MRTSRLLAAALAVAALTTLTACAPGAPRSTTTVSPAPAEPSFTSASTVLFDTAAYAADFTTPVARIPAENFLGEPTVVVPVETRGKWSLVLTPSRKLLPSKAPAGTAAAAGTAAPAQTAAWLPTSLLKPVAGLPARIVVSVSTQTLTITDEPYGGADGGLIGIHYQAQATG